MAQAVAHDFQKKSRTEDVLISENVDFDGMLLSEPVLSGLKKSGFKRPSPIQLKAIPLGRCGLDLIVQAKSGTGKTGVFTVVALESIQLDTLSTQVLVLAPTREIVVQIWEVISSVSKDMPKFHCQMFIGGTPLNPDKQKLRQCHIAVGTPGRIRQLIENDIFSTESIRLFVLDEADKLLEDSFQEQINWIYSTLPDNKQMLTLSATYPEYMARHLTMYMRDPTFVRLNSEDPALLGIKQYLELSPFHPFPHKVFESKTKVLIKLLSSVSFQQCLVFSNLQSRAQTLCDTLNAKGWPSECIAGCLEQQQRLDAMEKLKNFRCRVLVSTDLTARGIDAENVNLVVNLDLPYDHETYLHRIGRAGRFGSFGAAVTFISGEEEKAKLRDLEKKCSTVIHKLPDPVPSDLVEREIPVNLSSLVTTEKIITRSQDKKHTDKEANDKNHLDDMNNYTGDKLSVNGIGDHLGGGERNVEKTVGNRSLTDRPLLDRVDSDRSSTTLKQTMKPELIDTVNSSIPNMAAPSEPLLANGISTRKELESSIEWTKTDSLKVDMDQNREKENVVKQNDFDLSDCEEKSVGSLKENVTIGNVTGSKPESIDPSNANPIQGNGSQLSQDDSKISDKITATYSIKDSLKNTEKDNNGSSTTKSEVPESDKLSPGVERSEHHKTANKKGKGRKGGKKVQSVLMEEFGGGSSFEIFNTDMVVLERPQSSPKPTFLNPLIQNGQSGKGIPKTVIPDRPFSNGLVDSASEQLMVPKNKAEPKYHTALKSKVKEKTVSSKGTELVQDSNQMSAAGKGRKIISATRRRKVATMTNPFPFIEQPSGEESYKKSSEDNNNGGQTISPSDVSEFQEYTVKPAAIDTRPVKAIVHSSVIKVPSKHSNDNGLEKNEIKEDIQSKVSNKVNIDIQTTGERKPQKVQMKSHTYTSALESYEAFLQTWNEPASRSSKGHWKNLLMSKCKQTNKEGKFSDIDFQKVMSVLNHLSIDSKRSLTDNPMEKIDSEFQPLGISDNKHLKEEISNLRGSVYESFSDNLRLLKTPSLGSESKNSYGKTVSSQKPSQASDKPETKEIAHKYNSSEKLQVVLTSNGKRTVLSNTNEGNVHILSSVVTKQLDSIENELTEHTRDIYVSNKTKLLTNGAKPKQPSTYGAKAKQPSTNGAKPKQPSTNGAKPKQPSTNGAKPKQPPTNGAKQEQASCERVSVDFSSGTEDSTSQSCTSSSDMESIDEAECDETFREDQHKSGYPWSSLYNWYNYPEYSSQIPEESADYSQQHAWYNPVVHASCNPAVHNWYNAAIHPWCNPSYAWNGYGSPSGYPYPMSWNSLEYPYQRRSYNTPQMYPPSYNPYCRFSTKPSATASSTRPPQLNCATREDMPQTVRNTNNNFDFHKMKDILKYQFDYLNYMKRS